MLLTFKNTRSVIKAEKALQKMNIDVKVIPVPRSISSECGMALEIKEDNISAIEDILKNLNLNFERHDNYEK